MLDLKATFGKRYKNQLDESYHVEKSPGKEKEIAWYYELVGKYGTIYNHSDTHLQVWINSTRLGARLSHHLPADWTLHSSCSEGFGFVLPNSGIGIALNQIKPKKCRVGRPAPHLTQYQFKPKAEVQP
jgi:hypothetical protein